MGVTAECVRAEIALAFAPPAQFGLVLDGQGLVGRDIAEALLGVGRHRQLRGDDVDHGRRLGKRPLQRLRRLDPLAGADVDSLWPGSYLLRMTSPCATAFISMTMPQSDPEAARPAVCR